MSNTRKLYQWISSRIALPIRKEELDSLVREFMPSGSGFDSGTQLDKDACSEDKIVFITAFHHMGENGYYDGWTQHKVIVTPSFNGFNVRVTGLNRNDIKDYIGDHFYDCLNSRIAGTFDKETQEFTFAYDRSE
jgi:hypothetical protein